MNILRRRVQALEAQGKQISDDALVVTVMDREADISAWLLATGGDDTEKSAVWGQILKQVDGRSKGLPQERVS